nr:ethylene-responsive transcription factor 2-like [Lolium perenne]
MGRSTRFNIIQRVTSLTGELNFKGVAPLSRELSGCVKKRRALKSLPRPRFWAIARRKVAASAGARYKRHAGAHANCPESSVARVSLRLRLPPLASLPPTSRPRRRSVSDDSMPPCCRSAFDYRGVRARPSGRFDAEIRSGEERIRLSTFDTAHEAVRAYDAVAWRLGRSRRQMNFHDDERLRLEWARQFPEDVTTMEAFYAQKEEQKAAVAKKKADREKRRAESASRKAARVEKAARRAEEKKNGTGPSTIILSSSSSSSFEWTSTPVSDTTLSSHSSDFDWDSE